MHIKKFLKQILNKKTVCVVYSLKAVLLAVKVIKNE